MKTLQHMTILGCAMLMTGQAYSQTPDRPTTAPATTPTQTPAQDQSPSAIKVTKIKVKDSKPGTEKDVALGDFVILELNTQWEKILSQQKSPANKLGLFINDLFIKGLEPMPMPENPNAVMFHLKRNADNRGAWSVLFGRKSFFPGASKDEELELTVGLQDGSWGAKDPQVLYLEYFPNPIGSKFVLIVSILVAIATVVLGVKTPMLRNSGDPPADGKKRSYSLARFQMALWFVTVLCAFGFAYAVTGDMSPIPQGTLVLMGIGAGTALGAAAIDLNKRTASKNDQINLTAAQTSFQQQVQDLRTKMSRMPTTNPNLTLLQQQRLDTQQRLATVTLQLAQISPTQAVGSRSFFIDLLSDENGVSFHRIQVFGWTLVFWAIFIITLIDQVTMVDFDTTQLALMGISGSTYLGFKLQEKRRMNEQSQV